MKIDAKEEACRERKEIGSIIRVILNELYLLPTSTKNHKHFNLPMILLIPFNTRNHPIPDSGLSNGHLQVIISYNCRHNSKKA